MRPNIVVINPDQMRSDALRCNGNPDAYTPNIDALAQSGVSFSNAYCQNPVCVPSRCSFMTGLYPHVHGHRTMSYLLRDGEPNLFYELKQSGYFTWTNARGDLLAGQDRAWQKKCLDMQDQSVGRENYPDEGRGEPGSDLYFSFYRGTIRCENGHTVENADTVWTEHAVDMIRSRPKDKPLFLFLGLIDPHPPYRVEEKYLEHVGDGSHWPRRDNLRADGQKPSMEAGLYESLGVSGWDEERFRALRRTYLGMCTKVDDLVGRVVTALKEEGIYDDTLIIVLSDHGDYTGDYGLVEKAQNTFPDCLVKVPLIVKPPKGESVGPGLNDSLVELVDFYATVVDYAHVDPERTHFGRSLRKLLAGEEAVHREYVFSEGGRNHGEIHCIENKFDGVDEYDPRLSLQASEGAEHTKATMIRSREYKYVKRLYEKDEFYDLKKGEDINLIDDPQYRTELHQMEKALLSWYQETADVVPFDADQRLPDEYFVNLAIAGGMPAEAYLKEEVLEKGRPFFEVIREMLAQSAKTAQK